MVNKNRALKVLSSVTATTIVASSLFASTLVGSTSTPSKALASTKVSTTFDAGIANDERLIEMLKQEGKLAKNASPAEAEKALKNYLKAKGQSTMTKDKLPKAIANIKEDEQALPNGLKNGKGNKLGQAKKSTVDSVTEEGYNGEVRTDKVLVLAIDFPDYRTGSITKE
ncbi:MAG: protease, partial [Neobacillus sp.]|nr:protease [Neobacillus sp.]